MFKHFFKILGNRAKVQALDFGLELLISVLNEYRRANKDGLFDAHKANEQPFETNRVETPQTVNAPVDEQKNTLFNIFKK